MNNKNGAQHLVAENQQAFSLKRNQSGESKSPSDQPCPDNFLEAGLREVDVYHSMFGFKFLILGAFFST